MFVHPDFAISLDAAYVVPFTHIENHDFVAISMSLQWW